MGEITQQLNLWESIMPNYEIGNRKIRLIELFSGIGAQYKALKLLVGENNVESYKTCEWSYNSIIFYNAIHHKDNTDYSKDLSRDQLLNYLNGNISLNYNEPADLTKKDIEWLRKCYNNCKSTHNLMNIMNVKGSDLEIVDTDKFVYLMTYSFPCQDLSTAGLMKGMGTSQAKGGTRSGLLWEVERILTELDYKNRPQLLLMENVPQVIGSNAIKDFQKWRYRLEQLGYSNYCEVLNAKDYGIPQNRQRAFMISILGDYSYTFPHKLELKHKLKDFLQKNVDEKYYLSKETIERISQWKAQQDPLKDIDKEKTLCPTLTARVAGEEHSGMVLINENAGGGLLFKENEIVDYSSSADFMRNHGNEIAPTLVCHDKFGVVVKRYKNYVTWKNKNGDFNTQCNRAMTENDLCLTLACNSVPQILEEEKNGKDKDNK